VSEQGEGLIVQPEAAEKPLKTSENLKQDELQLPQNTAVLTLFRKQFNEDPAVERKAQGLEKLLNRFFASEVENFSVFRVEDGDAAFPYTSFNVTEFARNLVGRSGEATRTSELQTATYAVEVGKKQKKPQVKKHFIFPSVVALQNGNPFTFVEVAMSQFMKDLPNVVGDIRQGKEPDQIEIYTCGSPTNWWGEVSPNWLEGLKEKGFAQYGQAYSRFVESKLPKEPDEKARTSVTFYGWSMGANMSVATADNLLGSGTLAQYGEKDKDSKSPRLQLLLDNPVGFHKSLVRLGQIPVGFLGEAVYQYIFHRTAAKPALEEKGFLESLDPKLRERGLITKMDKEQKKLKKKALITTLVKLVKGQPPEEVRPQVFVRSGLADPVGTYPSRYLKVHEQEVQGNKSVVRMRPNVNKNTREFLVKMTHTPPFFRKNILARWDKTVTSLLETKLL